MKYFSFLILIFTINTLSAQTIDTSTNWETQFYNKTIISLNTTPLLVQLIPFNRTNPNLFGPYGVSFARYKDQNNAFTIALGVNLKEFDNNTDELFFNLKVGWEKRKAFYEHWYYTKAWDIFLVGNHLNTPGSSNTESFVIGTGPTWGIGYNFNPMVGIHLESSLLLGLDLNFGIVNFEFIPPVAVYFHAAIPKKKRRRRS